jgi:hypothetical protein
VSAAGYRVALVRGRRGGCGAVGRARGPGDVDDAQVHCAGHAGVRLRASWFLDVARFPDAARLIPHAIARNDMPAAKPREISSRSASDNRSSQRCRALGRLPRASAMNLRSDEFRRPRCLAMRLTGTPTSRMSQIVFLSS